MEILRIVKGNQFYLKIPTTKKNLAGVEEYLDPALIEELDVTLLKSPLGIEVNVPFEIIRIENSNIIVAECKNLPMAIYGVRVSGKIAGVDVLSEEKELIQIVANNALSNVTADVLEGEPAYNINIAIQLISDTSIVASSEIETLEELKRNVADVIEESQIATEDSVLATQKAKEATSGANTATEKAYEAIADMAGATTQMEQKVNEAVIEAKQDVAQTISKAEADINNAVKRADDATQDAKDATDDAKSATSEANKATINANNATSRANASASNADTSATNANNKAKIAQTQADYAKQQGNLAKSEAENAHSMAYYAKKQGDYAYEQGKKIDDLIHYECATIAEIDAIFDESSPESGS